MTQDDLALRITKTKHKRWYRKAPPEGHAAA